MPATITLIGFHSAMRCSASGSVSVGTKALLRNVIGNTTVNPTPESRSWSASRMS